MRPAIFFTLVLAFFLGIGLIWLVLASRSVEFTPVEIKAVDDVSLPAIDIATGEFSLLAEERYEEILSRPIFSEERKPFEIPEESEDETEEAVAENVDESELEIMLSGVIITPKDKIAMFVEKSSNTNYSLKAGSELTGALEGWKLTKVESRSIEITEINGSAIKAIELPIYKGNLGKSKASLGSGPSNRKVRRVSTDNRRNTKDNRSDRRNSQQDRETDEIERRKAEIREKIEAERAKRREEYKARRQESYEKTRIEREENENGI